MEKNLLRQHFPMLPTRADLEELIRKSPALYTVFMEWSEEQQKEFLDFCTGERGVKILYDSFFKEIFNPETTPERLEELLSLIMKQPVKILQVLPNDSTRIADEASLLVTDIVVELADHSIACVEIQKVGYMFPGQRSACYSADMLLRQYKRVRSRKKKSFSYKHIKNAYTVIFIERSTKEFHQFPEEYLHYFTQKSDTGLELNLLQKYYFVPLDIFRKTIQNKGIQTKLDAWLTFLTSDEPEMILELIQTFPDFKALYEDIYELCRNIEGVMNMFSKELRELDRNTVQYMIDVMQDEIDASKKMLSEKDKLLSEKEQLLQQQALEAHLYSLLSADNRLAELGRAVSDEAFRRQLLEEYGLKN
ncbi:MAG: PD-(D/E)XK nuclease family transposase [Lachnospiraceae bacterium]|nr:PD-(D/E)XK nuclease family transposase [Lachnospiraceae bacterium]